MSMDSGPNGQHLFLPEVRVCRAYLFGDSFLLDPLHEVLRISYHPVGEGGIFLGRRRALPI
jgi:hypothetical protein